MKLIFGLPVKITAIGEHSDEVILGKVIEEAEIIPQIRKLYCR